MWLGRENIAPYEEWLYNSDSKISRKETVEYLSVLVKTFWELLCNAIDASIKNTGVRNIEICFDRKTGMFSVYNDGAGIPIVFDDRVNQWLREAIATNPFSDIKLKRKINNVELVVWNGIRLFETRQFLCIQIHY